LKLTRGKPIRDRVLREGEVIEAQEKSTELPDEKGKK